MEADTMKRGYIRVSTTGQDLRSQRAKVKQAGAEKVYSEKKSGTKTDGRTELAKLLKDLQRGDEVLVCKIDRLARSIMDLKNIILQVNEAGASITFLDNSLTFTPDSNNPMNELMLNMLASFAQFERDLIVSRTQEGKEYAKATNPNYKEGRPKRRVQDNPQYLHALKLMETHSKAETAKLTGISTATLGRIKRQWKEEQAL